jgi:hypothetical protein
MAAEFKPYKGTDSYQAEDAGLFFGRRRDADQVVAKLLSSRISLLHAQSGAGKTSLLNALIAPELEARGWTPVRVLPHNDPIASARAATLRYVLPHPEAEILSLQRLIDGMAAPGEEPSLGELLKRYDNLPVRDPRKRALIAPVDPGSTGDRRAETASGSVTPYVCRLLRSSIDIETFAQHLAAIAQGAEPRPKSAPSISEAATMRQLLLYLSSDDFLSAYRALMSYLDPPSRGLRPFFENLFLVYGRRRSHFGLALLFDQFEELFTRFVDPGSLTRPEAPAVLDWRLRYEFFDELSALVSANADGESDRGGPQRAEPRLSVRCLISMRSEYIAQLGPIRRFAPEVDESVYHLELLTTEEAERAIKEPASLYGYGYSDECYRSIVRDLTKEERFIEPAHLSLVCEKLWEERGRALSSSRVASGNGGELPQVDNSTYSEDLKGAKGILGAFFQDFLNSLEDPDSRTESLDMLEPLITGSGTRNIVEYRQLVVSPLRDAALRKRLLDRMVDRTILRVETRLGGQFVEITHEFLIPSIQEALRRLLNYPLRSSLRSLIAASSVDSLARPDFESVLTSSEFRILHENRRKIVWDDCATEVLFRAAIYFGSDREVVRIWSESYAARDVVSDLPGALARLEGGEEERNTLSASDLEQLNGRRSAQRLSETQLAAVLRSSLLHETEEGGDNVRYWTRRLAQ